VIEAGYIFSAAICTMVALRHVCHALTERARQHTERARLRADAAVREAEQHTRRAELRGITNEHAKAAMARIDAIEGIAKEAREKAVGALNKVTFGGGR
jgi:hypothetical protein